MLLACSGCGNRPWSLWATLSSASARSESVPASASRSLTQTSRCPGPPAATVAGGMLADDLGVVAGIRRGGDLLAQFRRVSALIQPPLVETRLLVTVRVSQALSAAYRSIIAS